MSFHAAALVLDEPLSLWGGLDPATGVIVDVRHPQRGASVTGRVVVMPAGRGSSSSASVLAEAARLGTAPVAIVLREPDLILAIGAAVADELYGVRIPVVFVAAGEYARMRDGVAVGDLRTASDGNNDVAASEEGPASSRPPAD